MHGSVGIISCSRVRETIQLFYAAEDTTIYWQVNRRSRNTILPFQLPSHKVGSRRGAVSLYHQVNVRGNVFLLFNYLIQKTGESPPFAGQNSPALALWAKEVYN